MQKIASPNELQAGLKALIATIHGHGPEGKPDRQVVASKLRGLADRVAAKKLKWVAFLTDKKDRIWQEGEATTSLAGGKRVVIWSAGETIPKSGEFDREIVWRGEAELPTQAMTQARRHVK